MVCACVYELYMFKFGGVRLSYVFAYVVLNVFVSRCLFLLCVCMFGYACVMCSCGLHDVCMLFVCVRMSY